MRWVKEHKGRWTEELKGSGGFYYNGSEVFEIFMSSSSYLKRLRDDKIYFLLKKTTIKEEEERETDGSY